MFIQKRRRFIIILAFILFYFTLTLLKPSSNSQIDQSNIIVSLTSIPARLDHHLPPTLRSLLKQSLSNIHIHIYIAFDDAHLFKQAYQTTPLLRHKRLVWIPVQDTGPSKKFIPAIQTYKNTSKIIIVCDDDTYYQPKFVETLALALLNQKEKQSVGLAGYRIQKGMVWGVSTLGSLFKWSEIKYHAIQGWRIKNKYKVGILSGNNGYAIMSNWFMNVNIEDYSKAPKEAKLVDDIWINGHLSRLGIARMIVECESVNIALGGKSLVEGNLEKVSSSRSEANNIMLKYFGKEFEGEGIEYEYGGKRGPSWANWVYLELVLPVKERWIEYCMSNDVKSAYNGQ